MDGEPWKLMRLLGGRWGNLEKPAPDDRVRCFLDRKAQSWCSTRSVDWYYSTRKCIAVYGQRQAEGCLIHWLFVCFFLRTSASSIRYEDHAATMEQVGITASISGSVPLNNSGPGDIMSARKNRWPRNASRLSKDGDWL